MVSTLLYICDGGGGASRVPASYQRATIPCTIVRSIYQGNISRAFIRMPDCRTGGRESDDEFTSE